MSEFQHLSSQFPPHFAKPWLSFSFAVRQTILQQLQDIITLLDPETDLKDFQFRTLDFEQTVEEILAEELKKIKNEQNLVELSDNHHSSYEQVNPMNQENSFDKLQLTDAEYQQLKQEIIEYLQEQIDGYMNYLRNEWLNEAVEEQLNQRLAKKEDVN